jgi:transcriptional regulator with XRE-family HTH domain
MKSPKKESGSVVSPSAGNPMCVALGENLKRIRQARGMTQQNLAFSAELDRTFVSLCERGLTNPSLYSLGTLCWCLKITLAELFAGIPYTVAPSAQTDVKRRKNQASHESRPPSAATLKRMETMRRKKLAEQQQTVPSKPKRTTA